MRMLSIRLRCEAEAEAHTHTQTRASAYVSSSSLVECAHIWLLHKYIICNRAVAPGWRWDLWSTASGAEYNLFRSIWLINSHLQFTRVRKNVYICIFSCTRAYSKCLWKRQTILSLPCLCLAIPSLCVPPSMCCKRVHRHTRAHTQHTHRGRIKQTIRNRRKRDTNYSTYVPTAVDTATTKSTRSRAFK